MDDILEKRVMAVLERHRGEENCIGMGELWRKVFRLPYNHRINDTSPLRRVIRNLCRQGKPICSTCNKYNPGYYLPANPEELAKNKARKWGRIMSSITQLAAIERIAVPELLGQLKLEAESQ